MTGTEIIKGTGGKLLAGELTATVSGVSIDSRTINSGEMFVAVKGPNFDGHDYIMQSLSKGASGLLLSGNWEGGNSDVLVIKVDNTTEALGKLANYVRNLHPLKLIGVTGSCGKTTTKNALARCLGRKFNVHCSEGNYNNLYGLPLVLLKCGKENNIAVCEMGISYPGEMKKLTAIAEPDVAVITNIRPVHIGNFNNIEHIAKSKMEITTAMKKEGRLILNGDCHELMEAAGCWKNEKILYGRGANCDFRLTNFSSKGVFGSSFEINDSDGNSVQFWIKLPGVHNAFNILAAVACAVDSGVELEECSVLLKDMEPERGRGNIIGLKGGITIVDESYNSNPQSLKSVVDVMDETEFDGRKILVSGDMLELGEKSSFYHLELANYIAEKNIDFLITVGDESAVMERALTGKTIEYKHFSDSESVAQEICKIANKGDLLVIKGSRGMATEVVVNALVDKEGEI